VENEDDYSIFSAEIQGYRFVMIKHDLARVLPFESHFEEEAWLRVPTELSCVNQNHFQHFWQFGLILRILFKNQVIHRIYWALEGRWRRVGRMEGGTYDQR
jgi:hypothetical protein